MAQEYTNSRIREIIEEYIHSDRDQQILTLRLVRGWTFERISEEVDMSVKQVQRITYKLQEQLFKHM